jgi:hypothetical protein
MATENRLSVEADAALFSTFTLSATFWLLLTIETTQQVIDACMRLLKRLQNR